MSQEQTSGHCNACRRSTLMVREKPNHILHLLISLFTFGAWVLVWLLISVGKLGGKYRCTQCGTEQKEAKPADKIIMWLVITLFALPIAYCNHLSSKPPNMPAAQPVQGAAQGQ